MSKKKKPLNTFGYTQLRKYINSYHHFSFRTPRKGKDYTPQQKSAIRRKYNQLVDLVKATRLETASFINTEKLRKKDIPSHDGVKTNKGFFYKYPYSKIKKVSLKRGEPKTYMIVTDYRLVKYSMVRKGTSSDQVRYTFKIPEYVKTLHSVTVEENGEYTEHVGFFDYTDALIEHYKPDAVMIGAGANNKGQLDRRSLRYDKKQFLKYITETEYGTEFVGSYIILIFFK